MSSPSRSLARAMTTRLVKARLTCQQGKASSNVRSMAPMVRSRLSG